MLLQMLLQLLKGAQSLKKAITTSLAASLKLFPSSLMARKEVISYKSAIPITFSTRAGPQSRSMVFYAGGNISQDAEFVYLKLNGIGIHTEELITKLGEFMGPFPTIVTFAARPVCGIVGGPLSTSWYTKSHQHTSFGPNSDLDEGVYRGVVRSWDGYHGLGNISRFPEWSLRLKKWRVLPYVNVACQGLGDHCVDHTFMWRKSGANAHIIFEVRMEGRLSFLAADGRNFIKPYKYTYEDLVSEKQTFSVTNSS